MKRKTVLAPCPPRYAGTVWTIGHGLALMMVPTRVVLVGAVAIAEVGYGRWLRFVGPLLWGTRLVSAAIIGTFVTIAA